MKHIYLGTALAIAVLVATVVLLRMNSTLHYPKVVAAFPGNITLTIIDQPWTDPEKCARENRAITAKLKKTYPNSDIRASCPAELDATEARAFHGQASDLPVVYSESEVILVKAETKLAMSVCSGMAAQITKQKIQTARCVAPAGTH